MGFRAIAALIVLACLGGQAASALEADVGGVRINVVGPKSYCPLEKANPADKEMLETNQELLKGKNDLLAIFASCDRLTAWRAGKADSLGDSAQYQVSLKNKTQQYAADKMIPQLCAEIRKSGSAAIKSAETEINKRYDSVKATAGSLKVNEQKLYGVLHEDKTGCYHGIVQKLEVEGKATTMFIVQAFLVVKGKLLFFNNGSDLEGPATVQRLLEASRSAVAATLAQN